MLSQIAILLKNIRQNVNPSVKIFYKNPDSEGRNKPVFIFPNSKQISKADFYFHLKLYILREPWERYHIADVTHSGYKQHQAFKPKAKTGMRT